MRSFPAVLPALLVLAAATSATADTGNAVPVAVEDPGTTSSGDAARAQAEPSWPAGADVRHLTHDGSAVGPLAELRVAGKFTVFDVYAEWCLPCRDVDAHLREVVARRTDVAVRKLNLVDFESPLGLELGDAIQGLPYLVIFGPDGQKTEITGLNTGKIDAALARQR